MTSNGGHERRRSKRSGCREEDNEIHGGKGGRGEGNLLLPLICLQLRFGTYANLVPMVVPLVVGRSTSKWLGDKAVVKVRLHVKFVGHQPRPIVPVLLKRKGKERKGKGGAGKEKEYSF